MQITAHGKTDIGRLRETNEDACLIDRELGLFAVSDGVGGRSAGEVAASLTMEALGRHVRKHRAVVQKVRSEKAAHRQLLELVTTAAQEACRMVHRSASSESGRSGMACTLTALLVAGNRAAMAHVGDTRLYLVRDGACEQLSTDHTMAHELVLRGTLTAAEAQGSRYASVLTRAIGSHETVEVESLILDVLPDDTFLICSDGLSGSFEGLSEIAGLLAEQDLASIPSRLIDLANDRGGRDNITALVLRAQASDVEQEQMHRLGRQIRSQVQALREQHLFAGLRYANLLRLLELSRLEEHAPGEIVLSPGQSFGRMLLVMEGRYLLEAEGQDSRALGPSACIGHAALLSEQSFPATLRAEQSSKLLSLEGSRFQALCSRRPWLGVDLLRNLATHLLRDPNNRTR
ncbi:MAG: protein phosphatase 2C domain-containing protein [Planctomycetota bacterium]